MFGNVKNKSYICNNMSEYNITYKESGKRFSSGIIVRAKSEAKAIQEFRKKYPQAEFQGMVKI